MLNIRRTPDLVLLEKYLLAEKTFLSCDAWPPLKYRKTKGSSPQLNPEATSTKMELVPINSLIKWPTNIVSKLLPCAVRIHSLSRSIPCIPVGWDWWPPKVAKGSKEKKREHAFPIVVIATRYDLHSNPMPFLLRARYRRTWAISDLTSLHLLAWFEPLSWLKLP